MPLLQLQVRSTRVWMCLAALGVAMRAISAARGDEGMWLFDQPPLERLKADHGFEPSPDWFAHLRLASVRLPSGSGSFVSPRGLVMTNHHVGAEALQKLSTPERDLLKTGFLAASLDEELKCPDMELLVLLAIEDVTERVQRAAAQALDPAAAQRARQAEMNTIEQEAHAKTGLRCNVVTLFQGERYHLYQYREYTDVRLVFAPEQAVAFFGGDPDNFEFPRYDLDVCFFRAYENGQPAEIEHYLAWSRSGVQEGDLVFVSGNPGRTERLNTVAHLEFLRDRVFPLSLNNIRRREVNLSTYSSRSPEHARRAADELFSYQNARKARLGGLAGLQDPTLMEAKRADEQALWQAVQGDAVLRQRFGSAWDRVAQAVRVWDEIYEEHYLLERGQAFNTELFDIARTLLRAAEERAKPNPERLREFAEAGLPVLERRLFSPAPIYGDLETVKLADSLSLLVELLRADHPLVREVLAGRSPAARAAELVSGTRLFDVDLRRKLYEGGEQAVASCDDPMLALARLVDPAARSLRQRYDAEVDEPLKQAYTHIAQARYAVRGANTYPDATFTLRLAYGRVLGYPDNGRTIEPFTVLGGMFERAELQGHKEPFRLPDRWHDRRARLRLDTPYNFVSTADIIGGNSGSPVVNRQGEIVGIIFDGNIHSLVLNFMYTDAQARAISVDTRAIIEALEKVYDAHHLVQELLSGK